MYQDSSNYATVTSAGLKVFQNDGTEQASFGATSIIGRTAAEHVKISGTGFQVKDGSTIYGQFGSGSSNPTTTIGVTGSEHIEITPTSLKLKDGGTTRISMDSSGVQIGAEASGITLD